MFYFFDIFFYFIVVVLSFFFDVFFLEVFLNSSVFFEGVLGNKNVLLIIGNVFVEVENCFSGFY